MSTINIDALAPVSFVPKEISKSSQYLFLSLVGLIGLVLSFQGPIITPDTGSYLVYHAIRSPLYPLFLKLNSIFEPYTYNIIVVIQIFFGFYSSWHLSKVIQKFFNLESWFTFIVFFIFLFPYFGQCKIGNTLLTEALCYPLFLLFVSFLLKGLLEKNTKYLITSFIITMFLILTRRQFLFIYPVISLILVYYALFERKNFKIKLLTFLFILSCGATSLIEKTYHYIHTGHFNSTPFTGIQLIIAPLYRSNESDVQLFKKDIQKNIFIKTREKMHQKNAFFDSTKDYCVFHYFTFSYNPIQWESLFPTLHQFGIEDFFYIDQLTTEMAFILIKQNFKSWFTLYFLNVVLSLGGYYYSLLLMFFFFVSLFFYITKRNNLALLSLVTITLTAANYSLVALVEPILMRYSIYTDTLLANIILILIFIALKDQYVRHNR